MYSAFQKLRENKYAYMLFCIERDVVERSHLGLVNAAYSYEHKFAPNDTVCHPKIKANIFTEEAVNNIE